MPRAFTEREKDLIRQRLLEQGHKQFSAHGLRKTNIEELAGAAGISKGAFYLFYPSKEALFMDVVEQIEERFRQDLFAAVDLPGPSPRARLFAVLKQAFDLLQTIPLLQFITGSDFDLLFRGMPPEKLQEHLASDQVFLQELVRRCQNAGIPIQVQAEDMRNLLYPLALTILHQGAYGVMGASGGFDVLLELVTAYCLGEVEVQLHTPGSPAHAREPGDSR